MNNHRTVATLKLVASLTLAILLTAPQADLAAQDRSSRGSEAASGVPRQQQRSSTTPFAVLTVNEDGTATLEPYDPEAEIQAAGEEVPARSVDPVADEDPPSGDVSLRSLDHQREPAGAGGGAVRLRSLDPVVDEAAAPAFEVEVWSVDSQDEVWPSGFGDPQVRAVDPLGEPLSPTPDQVPARSVDPMLEPGEGSGPKAEEQADGLPADEIRGAPDLTMFSISGFCNSDGTLAVAGTVANIGSADAGPFRVGVYASTNSTISTADTLIAFANYSGLSAGFQSNFSGDVSVSISPGVPFHAPWQSLFHLRWQGLGAV